MRGRNNFLIALLILGTAWNLCAQDSVQSPDTDGFERALAELIKADDIKSHLKVLASDAYEGRETGTSGQRKAAEYIATQFEKMGLPRVGDENSYFQGIAFSKQKWKNVSMNVNGVGQKHLKTFYSFPSMNRNRAVHRTNEVVFAGYGIDDANYSDYAGKNLRGKTILIYRGEPMTKDSFYHISGTNMPSDWSTNVRKKLEVAQKNGVSSVLVIDPNFSKNVNRFRKFFVNPPLALGSAADEDIEWAHSAMISSTLLKDILGKSKKKVVKARKKIEKSGKPRHVTVACDLTIVQEKSVESLLGENVLGYVEGRDVNLKDEVIVVSAHYDHLGKRGVDIWNGADDNGSGSATVLDIADAFVTAKNQGMGPRRSVLFLLVSGEEKGLLGSEYYAEYPVFPLGNTVANVNVDMIGRTDKAHQGNSNYIYVIGSDRLSTELHEINETANQKYTQLELDYTYNADDDPNRFYYRSDHYNFAKKGIPAIFYFSGTHEDYHRTTDTHDKIDYQKTAKIGKLIFHTAWELANRDDRIEVDVEGHN